MLSIALRFPAGRYHATPWSHHVNEGMVEWPPSPWRFARALVATHHLKPSASLDDARLTRVVEALGAEAPLYALPTATAAHTRHYMPLYKDKTTKVFDTFLHVGRDAAVQIQWPTVDLADDDRAALAVLLDRLSYLGRAESWVEARLLDVDEPLIAPNVRPLAPQAQLGSGEELVRVLAPLPKAELAAWRARAFEEELLRQHAEAREKHRAKGNDPDKAELTPKAKKNIDAMFPKNLLAALYLDTGELRKQGWNMVPGARWVDYVRPRVLTVLAPARRPRRNQSRLPTAARFAVASQVPPRLTDAVSMAERLRTALMSRSDAAQVFSGKHVDGRPLEGHSHAFLLPEANGRHGRITHVSVYAPMGFDQYARRAMDSLRSVWGRGGHDVQLVLLGVGQPEDFAGQDVRAGGSPLFLASSVWESRTPFVPTRHPKASRRGVPKLDAAGLQIGSAEHDLRRLLQEQGLPLPVRIERLETTSLSGKPTRWLEFRTQRSRGNGARAANAGTGFRIHFAEPVRGPIAVGYGAHFGLGMFSPVTDGGTDAA